VLFFVFFLHLLGIAYAEGERTDVPIGDSPTLGPVDAPVTIIEFLDYQ
jgi:hypothetical protein